MVAKNRQFPDDGLKQTISDPSEYRISVLMPTYNQEEYVVDAISAIISQDAPPFELIVCDDCSTDSTWGRVTDTLNGYTGKHSVRWMRNEKNLGVNGNLNRMIEIAQGDILIAAAGDDISSPDRVKLVVATFAREHPLLVFSAFRPLMAPDQIYDGSFDNLIFTRTTDPVAVAGSVALFVGATAAWHRDLFRLFGPLPNGPVYEDLILGYRAALAGRVAMIDAPLVDYRIGVGISFSGPADQSRVGWDTYRVNTLLRNAATFEQRRKDALAFGLKPDGAVVRALNRHFTLTEIRKDAVALPTMDFLRRHWRFPLFALRALRSEKRRARRALKP